MLLCKCPFPYPQTGVRRTILLIQQWRTPKTDFFEHVQTLFCSYRRTPDNTPSTYFGGLLSSPSRVFKGYLRSVTLAAGRLRPRRGPKEGSFPDQCGRSGSCGPAPREPARGRGPTTIRCLGDPVPHATRPACRQTPDRTPSWPQDRGESLCTEGRHPRPAYA